MSYTNETTHFGIPLPLGSDLTTPMDYNEAAEAVDAGLWQAGQDAATASSEAAGAVETANATAEALETLSGTVGTQGSSITALQARMTGAENEIGDVRSDLEDMITAFNEPTATSTHVYAIDDYFIYNDVLYKATAAINIGDTIVPNSNCAATNVMTEMTSGGGVVPTAADVSLAPIIDMSADNVQEGVEELKGLLSVFSFRVYNNVPQFSVDGGITWNILGGGSNMKCKLFGTVEPSTSGVSVDISSLSLTSAEDYIVICDGTGYSQGGTNATVWVDTKTSTSFTIKMTGNITSGSKVSYQVIVFE